MMGVRGSPPAPLGAGLSGRLRQVCQDAAHGLSASGVGLSVMAEDGVYAMGSASDLVTERIEELQFTFGEGPCVDARTTNRPVLIPELTDESMRRWPIVSRTRWGCGTTASWSWRAIPAG